jgi:HAD superfamily hydrolase (TIGR01509 family)
MHQPPFGAVFDWDGVIINSEEYHRVSWERLAEEDGLFLPEGHFEKSFGRKNAEIIPEILGWAQAPAAVEDLSFRKEEHYRRLVRERGVTALPGVIAWLEALEQAGVPCGIGSSTPRANIELSLSFLGCERFFRTVVSAEDVTRGKPAPDVFLTVAERIGVPPERCVVFEDALVGLEAAKNAGMRRVAVASTNPADLLKPNANRVVARLDELRVDDLASWFSSL